MEIDNVYDRRYNCIGSWEVEPLIYDKLDQEHIGQTVIYCSHNRAEAGTITSWRDGIVFAIYSQGDTAAGANAADLFLEIKTLP